MSGLNKARGLECCILLLPAGSAHAEENEMRMRMRMLLLLLLLLRLRLRVRLPMMVLMVLMVAQKQLTATPRQSADLKRYPAAAAVEWPACVRLPCHERID